MKFKFRVRNNVWNFFMMLIIWLGAQWQLNMIRPQWMAERTFFDDRHTCAHTYRKYARRTPSVTDESTVYSFRCAPNIKRFSFYLQIIVTRKWLLYTLVMLSNVYWPPIKYSIVSALLCLSALIVECTFGLCVWCVRMNMDGLRMYFSLSPPAKRK